MFQTTKKIEKILYGIIILLILALGFTLWSISKQSNSISDTSSNASNSEETCPQEAKLCPDGSSVERTGPNCEFEKCPETNNKIDGIKPKPSCQNFPGPNFCSGGISDIIVTGTNEDGCSTYGCKSDDDVTHENPKSKLCGDGVCDEIEKAHPELCPADCE